MRKRLIILAVVTALVLCAVGCAVFNPVRRGEQDIRATLLRQTPLGTPATQVLAMVRAQYAYNAWSEPRYEMRGAIRRTVRPYDPDRPGNRSVQERVGTRSIRDVHIGLYYPSGPLVPMVTHVFSSWAFNDADELIDIIVYKENDGP